MLRRVLQLALHVRKAERHIFDIVFFDQLEERGVFSGFFAGAVLVLAIFNSLVQNGSFYMLSSFIKAYPQPRQQKYSHPINIIRLIRKAFRPILFFLSFFFDGMRAFLLKSTRYGGRSSVVELLVVVQAVAGSIPVGRPTFFIFGY